MPDFKRLFMEKDHVLNMPVANPQGFSTETIKKKKKHFKRWSLMISAINILIAYKANQICHIFNSWMGNLVPLC